MRQHLNEASVLAGRSKAQSESVENSLIEIRSTVERVEYQYGVDQKSMMSRIDGIAAMAEKAELYANMAWEKNWGFG